MAIPDNTQDASFITIGVIDNAIEAQLVSSILTEQEIPHQIISHHDTAYDGLYQLQKGWGKSRRRTIRKPPSRTSFMR
ncbi:MAG: hypothetical protein R2860_07325 [Desulfobacterales bacterium]